MKALLLWAKEKAQFDKNIAEHDLWCAEKDLRHYFDRFIAYGGLYELNQIHLFVDQRVRCRNKLRLMNEVLLDIERLNLKIKYQRPHR